MGMRSRLVFFLALVAAAGLFAQSDSAALSGTVTDPSGAVVADAAVQVTNADTNVAQITRTNSVGLYSFPNLSPGRYRISVKNRGFKESVRTDLALHVGDTVAENFRMEIGSATETVSVSSEIPPMNTEDATVGTVVEREVVGNMPLNGRSFQGLITLSPGVTTITAATGSTGQFVVNGQRSDTNYFSVDGVSANVAAPIAGSLSSNGTGTTPTNSATGGFNNMVSVDALQEFRISTSSFAPEFGRSPGGQISMVSRAGTNAFHGDVFNYFRNTVLDANDWFLNAASKARGVVQQNDFGGVVGGPVVKNKLFFFVSYEGLRLQAPTPSVKQVLTSSARALTAAANDGGVVGYMAQFANAYPLPDGNPSTPCTTFANCTANYSASFPGKSTLDSTGARIDYSLNQRITLFGRYAHSPTSLTSDSSVNATTFNDGNDVYTAGLTWAVSNTMNNDLRFNFTHTTLVTGVTPLNFKGSMASIFPTGFAQPPASYLADPGTISVQLGTLPTDAFHLATANASNGNDQQNYTDSFGWVKGSHRFKFGVDYRELDPAYDQSNFNWNNQFAQTTTALTGFPSVANVCPASALPAGSSATVPGYICGQATLANLQHNFIQHFRYRQFSLFAQDTWKLSRRATITYGVRWDINPAPAWTSNNPGFSIQSSSYNPSNLSTININPLGTPAYPTTYGNFAPRLGVAYQLSDNPKWGRVLRAGYGIFYDTGSQVGSLLSNPYNARFNNQGSGAIAPTVQFPITTANAIYVTPPAARTTLPVSNGGTDNLINPNFNLPYVHQTNVTLEQQLGGRQTLSVGYVGAAGRRLVGSHLFPANAGNPAVFAQINPITGVATPDAIIIVGNYSSSSYHSLQSKFQRQFATGLAALASYTWSHSIDDASLSSQIATQTLPTPAQLSSGAPLALLRGNSDFDVRQNLALSAVYEIPSPTNAIARAILGHWSFDPIYHYQTAIPIDILTGASGAIGGTSYSQRPNLIGGVPIYVYGADCAAQNKGQGCPGGFELNTAPVSASVAAAAGCVAPTSTNAKGAFCTPLVVGTQTVSGNLGRNVVRAFPLQELDFSVHRDFPIREQIRLRFQVDMFNVVNHPSFGAQGATVNGTTFGATTNMANSALGANTGSGAGFNPIFNTGGPRNFQFALKLFFEDGEIA
jgi:Carboxypeptidase regulatory-like domain/TonB dependent receptor